MLEVLSELEEHNLSLVTNGQESEDALADLVTRFDDDRLRMKREFGHLQHAITEIQMEIKKEKERSHIAQDKAHFFKAAETNDEEQEMIKLGRKVDDAYRSLFGDNEANMTPLQMLTNIENKIEELFEQIELLPPELVEDAGKAKLKQRRLRDRKDKLELKRKHDEERLRKALERSNAEPVKHTGKKLVFRSAPPVKKRAVKLLRNQRDADEEEHEYYFT